MPGMMQKHDHKWDAYVWAGMLVGAAMLMFLWMLLKDWARLIPWW